MLTVLTSPPPGSPGHTDPMRHVLPATVAILCSGLLYAGACMLAAAVSDYQATLLLQDWESKRSEPADRAWRIARQAAEDAVLTYPASHGAYWYQLGQIEQWQSFNEPLGQLPNNESRATAITAYRRAIEARPEWPEAWVGLAQAKLYVLDFDEEFHAALSQARQLAPWRPHINARVAEIGLIAWPGLIEVSQQTTRSAIETISRLNPELARKIYATARQTGRASVFCASTTSELRPRLDGCQASQTPPSKNRQ